MTRIAHIVKVVAAPAGSEWAVAQPVTFASLRSARAFAAKTASVDLFAAGFADEHALLPEGFQATKPLDRSVMSFGSFRVPRPLPLLRDVLDRLFEQSDAEFFLYSNVDIAVMPHFYATLQRFIELGHDAIVVNRRTLPEHPHAVADLPLLYATIGKSHPGFDCFLFRRALYPRFALGDVCLGTGHVDLPLICSMIATASSFLLLENEHLTFHLGDRRVWRGRTMRDYQKHNDRAASAALLTLAKRAPRPLRLPCRVCLRMRLLKNSWIVSEFRRVFSR